MFQTLIYPSSGACDCAVELPHRSFCSGSLCVGDLVRLVLSSVRVAGSLCVGDLVRLGLSSVRVAG